MTRKEIYRDIEQTLGIVPTMFKSIPDSSLATEWEVFKQTQIDEGPIPNKYRELIGLGISAVTKCRYCAFYHTEPAKLYGTSQEELEEAVHFAKASAGSSSRIPRLHVHSVFDSWRKSTEFPPRRQKSPPPPPFVSPCE
jgi:AhpD family alkylhydroperoxidase